MQVYNNMMLTIETQLSCPRQFADIVLVHLQCLPYFLRCYGMLFDMLVHIFLLDAGHSG